MLTGEKEEIHSELFSEVTYHVEYEPMRAVRTQRWKYIKRFSSKDRPVASNCDPGVTKDQWIASGWLERPVMNEELYDLVFDPNETCNLASGEDHEAVKKELARKLADWMAATDDPLLSGPVPPPAPGLSAVRP